MKLIVLSTSDNLIRGDQKPLEDSLIKHGYDYDFFLYGFIFGEQYKVIKTWVDQYQGDATHVLYTDQYDTLALSSPDEVIRKWETMNNKLLVESLTNPNDKEKKGLKMLISCEKACFPNDERDKYHRIENYPETNSQWKYINGGGCMFEIEYFKELCKQHPFNEDRMMDPDWLCELYLSHPDQVKLDTNCDIFQCLAHSNQDEWEILPAIAYKGTMFEKTLFTRIKNKATNTLPIFIHGNGRTDMQWVRDIAANKAI